VFGGERKRMGQMVRFQETLRRLAMIDEGFVDDQAGLGLGLAGTPALHPKTAALLRPVISLETAGRWFPAASRPA